MQRPERAVVLPAVDHPGRLAVPWAGQEAERRDVLRALPEEPRADEEVALLPAADRSGRPAVPWAGREAERRGVLRALPEEPRADEEVALPAADRSEAQPARVGARPLAFLRSPSSPHVFLYRGLSSCNAQARSRCAVQARGRLPGLNSASLQLSHQLLGAGRARDCLLDRDQMPRN